MNPSENNRLDYMAAELDALKKDMSEVKAMVTDMYHILSGNPIDKDSNGMIGDLRTMKKEVYALKAEIKKYKAYFYAMVTLIGVGVLKFIVEFLKDL
jgi:t-SNARE complex subunit (syntaxin)